MPAKNTLEGHRLAVERASTGGQHIARANARRWCNANGISHPVWCAARPPGSWKRHAPPTPETHVAPTIEIGTAIAALRSAWSGPSRAFALRPNSVMLIDLSDGAARRCAMFGTVDLALAAIAADAIKWGPFRPAERLGLRAVA
jgi:hypothetical protein